MYEVLMEYKSQLRNAEKLGLPKPVIPRYIGECFLKIATGFSNKPNFSAYSWKEEMISDAVLNMVKYIDNFDGSKTNNPFAYFTQYAKNSFFRRISLEKEQQDIKVANGVRYGMLENLTNSGTSITPNKMEIYNDKIPNQNKKDLTRHKKNTKVSLEIFIDDKE